MRKEKKKTYEQECQRCGYQWFARLKKPKQCTKCKRYDWEEVK